MRKDRYELRREIGFVWVFDDVAEADMTQEEVVWRLNSLDEECADLRAEVARMTEERDAAIDAHEATAKRMMDAAEVREGMLSRLIEERDRHKAERDAEATRCDNLLRVVIKHIEETGYCDEYNDDEDTGLCDLAGCTYCDLVRAAECCRECGGEVTT